MDSGRLMISSAAPFSAAAAGGVRGQVLLFGSGGGFVGGAPAAARDERLKRPFQLTTAHEELLQLQLELTDDDTDHMCGLDYELHGEQTPERKRRLTAEQVRELELSFEAEKRKLEPERKTELARRLGIAPRQVAVWFQNRRARWKGKQLEQDFDRLRAAHDELLAGRDALLADNDRLRSQVILLTEKLQSKEPPATAAGLSSEATDAHAVEATVYVELIQDGQLCPEDFGFTGEGTYEYDSPESYSAGACSPPSSSEGDCGGGEEGGRSTTLLPDAMLIAAVDERGRGRTEEDGWEWLMWN